MIPFIVKRYEVFPALRQPGSGAEIEGPFLKKNKAENEDQKNYWLRLDSTVILGCGQKNEKPGKCAATWQFDISKLVRQKLISADLRIVTFRTTGGIHTGSNYKPNSHDFYQGRLFLNNSLVDNIDLVKQMPYGHDFGFNRLDPYPILNIIEQMKNDGRNCLQVKIEVDENVSWDIDEIRIESIICEKRDLHNWVWLVIGAIISTLLGGFAAPLTEMILRWFR